MLERRSPAQRESSAQPGSSPPRGATGRAAVQLLARHGGQVMATARRYAATPEDAEDAYQRGLEILLTKAPTTREEELVPWLKTVVKHEAFALRRQRDRLTPVTGDGEPVERGTTPAATHDKAERYERLSQGAEALRRLKPQEIRCLVLKAQGLTYREICEVTGWTYTKVNRCLTEGRQALTIHLAGIEGGIECARLAPLLSALADGEATSEQLALLRPHMKTCLACRARLREYRAAPSRVAALVPVGLLGAAPHQAEPLAGVESNQTDALAGAVRMKLEAVVSVFQQKAEAVLGATQHKAAAFAERGQTATELVTAQKVAALAASAAALAGGSTAADQLANHHGPPRPAASQQAHSPAIERTATTEPSPAPSPLTTEQSATTNGQPAPAAPPTPLDPPPPPAPEPANEFAPAGTSAASAAAAPASAAPSEQPPPAAPAAEPRPAPSPAPPASRSAGEFAP